VHKETCTAKTKYLCCQLNTIDMWGPWEEQGCNVIEIYFVLGLTLSIENLVDGQVVQAAQSSIRAAGIACKDVTVLRYIFKGRKNKVMK
jgi:hypothetical protein